jgi:hypothetical protein
VIHAAASAAADDDDDDDYEKRKLPLQLFAEVMRRLSKDQTITGLTLDETRPPTGMMAISTVQKCMLRFSMRFA